MKCINKTIHISASNRNLLGFLHYILIRILIIKVYLLFIAITDECNEPFVKSRGFVFIIVRPEECR